MFTQNICRRAIAMCSLQTNQLKLLPKNHVNNLLLNRQQKQIQSTFAPAVSISFASNSKQYPSISDQYAPFNRRKCTQTTIMVHRFYSDAESERKNLKKNERNLSKTIKEKSAKLRERKNVLVQDLRDKKAKVKSKMEEYVERENIFTIPNLLCVGRGILAPIVGYVIIQEQFTLAMGLLLVAGVTDLLDGFIARTWTSQASKLGSFLDPMADKLLVGSLVVSLSYCSLFPIWLSAMVILRDVFLIVAGFIIRFISLPAPRTFARYFDATHVTAKLEPTFTSKVNTAVQLTTVAASLGAPVWNYVDCLALQNMWYLTGFTTVAAALSYVLTKNTYKIISKSKQ